MLHDAGSYLSPKTLMELQHVGELKPICARPSCGGCSCKVICKTTAEGGGRVVGKVIEGMSAGCVGMVPIEYCWLGGCRGSFALTDSE